MWQDFLEKHGRDSVSYELYRSVFSSENISFAQPSQDDCEICVAFNQHAKDSLPEHDGDSCVMCVEAKKHLERARKARHEYQKPADIGKAYAADMQKIILLPKLTVKQHFFVSRLVVFNETFACLNADEPDFAVLWHEGLNGRDASAVASAYVKCLELSESMHVTFWADNCSSQNKNWTLFTALCLCVNSDWGPSEVTMKYLEKGHTYMKADSVHACIGKKLKKQSEVFTFPDFVSLVDCASKSVKSVVLEISDFYEFKPENRIRKSKHTTLPLLSTVCTAKFRKGSRFLFYKTDYEDEEYSEVDFLKPRFMETSFPPTKCSPRGIKPTKKEGILKLLNDAPNAKKNLVGIANQ